MSCLFYQFSSLRWYRLTNLEISVTNNMGYTQNPNVSIDVFKVNNNTDEWQSLFGPQSQVSP